MRAIPRYTPVLCSLVKNVYPQRESEQESEREMTMKITMTNMLFDHNIQIEIIMYNSLENQIIDWSGDYY